MILQGLRDALRQRRELHLLLAALGRASKHKFTEYQILCSEAQRVALDAGCEDELRQVLRDWMGKVSRRAK